MREIKFRAWDTIDNSFINIDNMPIKELQNLFRTKIMQFTGLQDKTGVDIYEGDLLHFVTFGFEPEVFTTEIIYKDCAFKLKNGRSLFYFGQINLTKLDDAKIVGNIYEGIY